jgi:uncharacterized membrane protein
MKPWLARGVVVLAAAYPVLVYFSLDTFPAVALGALLLVLAAGRLLMLRQAPEEPLLIAAGVVAMVAAGTYTVISRSTDGLRFYPVLMSAAMLALFAWSLGQPQSLIERVARFVYTDLPPAAVVYARRVTLVWCGFFALNGLVALWTAVAASWATWTFYNGFLSYVLMGGLCAIEYAVRQRHLGTVA